MYFLFSGKTAPPDLQPRGLRDIFEEMGPKTRQWELGFPLPNSHELRLRVQQIPEYHFPGLQEPDVDFFGLGNDPETVRNRERALGETKIRPQAGLP